MSHAVVNRPRRTVSPLRVRRVELGFTQAELAAAAERSREQLSRIETGASEPRVSTLRAYAGVLECDVAELLRFPSDRATSARQIDPTNSDAPVDETEATQNSGRQPRHVPGY